MKPLIILFILSALSLQSQSISIFDIDTTNFPTMRAKFYAFASDGNQARPSASELTLSEDGVQRTITNVSCPNTRYSLSACIMVDTYSYIDLARKGAERFVSFLQMPPDEVGITYMAGAPLIHRDFTRDRTKAVNATTTIPSAPGVDIQRMFYSEKTGGVPFIIPRKNDRKALILITDLHCPNLNLDEARLYADAKANGIRVFSVLLGTTDYSGLFKRVAKETKGEVFENVSGETQIYNVLEEIARKLTLEPCTIEWQSDFICKSSNFIEAELSYQSAKDKESYFVSNEKKAELTFSPIYIRFENPPINTKISQEITITAKNKDFNISDIILSNPLYEVTPKSLVIPANQSKKLIVSYTAFDSAYTFCKFEVKTDLCDQQFFANSGWKGVRPKIKSLKLTHPNGGETFTAGSDTIISWEGIPATDTVKLEYSIDSGKTWKNITDKGTGLKYKWENVPLPASNKCLVKVSQFEKTQPTEDTLITLKGHNNSVYRVSFSPNGKHVATASADQTIRIWDARSGKIQLTFYSGSFSLSDLAYSPDGSQLAIASYDRTARIWDASNGEQLRTFIGHTDAVYGISFSPDGNRIATSSADRTARIWETNSEALILTLTGHTEQVNRVVYSPDGTKIVTASYDKTARIWDASDGTLLQTLSNSSVVYGVAFSPDGSLVATSNSEGIAIIWEVNSGNIVQILAGYSSSILNIVFSPDGSHVATVGYDLIPRTWDIKSGKQIQFFRGHTSAVLDIDYSPDGTKIATASEDHTAKIWKIGEPILQTDTSDAVFSIIAPDMALKVTDIDMGRVLVGSSVDKTETAVICNEGTAPLHVLGLDVTNGNTSEFAVPRGAGDFFLAPGECQTITFQFSPTQVGPRNAKITVRSTVGDKVDSIRIRGEGVIETLALSTDIIDMGVEFVENQKDSIVAVLENKGSTIINIKPVQYLDNKDVLFFDNSITNFDLAANTSKSLTLYFKPKEEGRVTGRIGFEYNGTGSPLVMLLFGTGIDTAYGEVKAPSIEAKAGEKVSLPLILTSDTYLNKSKTTTLSLDLEYNRTLLRPIGNYNPINNGDKATINLNIPYNKQKAGETLTTIDFEVALGNAQGCELTLTNPKSNDNNAVIYAKSGSFTLLGICEDGGARLINPELQAGIMSISPNPTNDNFNIEVSLIEAAPSELILLNSLGQQVMTILSTTDTGKHTKSVSTDQLSTGIYYLQLRTATYIENKVIRVER
jgi:WD40 repeat protein